MDHMMPVMDGIEATKKLREMGYTNSIIALTANALVGQSENFLQNGFDAFISKPINSREMNDILNEHICSKKPDEVVTKARLEQSKFQMEEKPVTVNDTNRMSEIVKAFIRDANKALDVLKEKLPIINSMDEEDLKSYIITVHSLKSAFANINKEELSNDALRLELAARNYDYDLLAKETPALIEAIIKLNNEFNFKNETSNTTVSEEDAACLKEKLFFIKSACDAYDKKAAKSALADLKQKNWPPYINDKLEEISIAILHSDFKEAAVTADNTSL